MKKTSMVKVFGLALLLTAQTVFGLSSYVSRIPNGSVNGCINCHGASGPPLNSFGNDFLDNAKSYTGLGSIDSDGDGYTNDQELNATPPTLPGNASSKPTATVTAPSITTQPASQTVTAGANVSFSVVATGTAQLNYQWMKNGANITGASSSTLALTAVTTANAGSYTVRVSNSAGPVTSAAAVLTVNAAVVAPVITTQPASQTVIAGANVSFSVVATGTAPLSYQWMKNGANITGASSSTLALMAVTSANAGSYTVRVSNSAGPVTSAAAVLTVNAAVVAPVITTQPASQTVTAGANVSFSVVATGTAPLNYQWMKNGADITGASSSTLALTAVTTANAGSYTVRVSNSAGPVTSAAAVLAVNAAGTAPTITLQPISQTVTAGANVTFMVAASGTTPLSYQWMKNGANITGATGPSYVLMAVSSANAGSYSVKLSNSVGSVTSSAAILTVNPAPAVLNIALTSPTNGQSFIAPADVPLQVAITPATGIASVQYFDHGTNLLGTVTTAPFSMTASNLLAGNYVLTAQVTDSTGATDVSEPVTLAINTTQPPSTNPAPVVQITTPRDGATYYAPDRVLLLAQASDNGSVTKVEFFSGSTRIGVGVAFRSEDDDDEHDGGDDESVSQRATMYFLVLNRVPAGQYSITAQATDNLGAVTTSEPVRIVVKRSRYNGSSQRDD